MPSAAATADCTNLEQHSAEGTEIIIVGGIVVYCKTFNSPYL